MCIRNCTTANYRQVKKGIISSTENKNNAIAFYKTAYEGNPKNAIEQYVGAEYIQHNPDDADGTQGLTVISKECRKNTLVNLSNL
jgi:predicted SnoaL-like aldol condensation-catalyzing enzyme